MSTVPRKNPRSCAFVQPDTMTGKNGDDVSVIHVRYHNFFTRDTMSHRPPTTTAK